MTKQRVAIFKNLWGRYLTATGGTTTDLAQAVRVREDDARHCARRFQACQWDDPYRGASMELLPKRGRTTCLSADEFQQFLAALDLQRLVAEANKYERMAGGYLSSAREAERLAEMMRTKAAAIRARLS